jgi:hypothetical protein
VGFAQPEMFDVPLLTTGLEHVYLVSNPWPETPLKFSSARPSNATL